MRRTTKSWTPLALGSGGFVTFAGVVTAGMYKHVSPAAQVATYVFATVLVIASAVVAVVKIRTDQPPESRRMSALARLARKHPSTDQSMRLLVAEGVLNKAQPLASDQVVTVLNSSPAEPPRSGGPDLKGLVELADSGKAVVPDHPPGIDGQPGTDLELSGGELAAPVL